MSETVTEFENGKMTLRVDGMELTVGHKPNEVRLTDSESRYYATFSRGDMLGSGPTQDQKLAAMRDVLREYLTFRGTRTSWTQEDAWLRRWRKNHASDKTFDFQAACSSNSSPS